MRAPIAPNASPPSRADRDRGFSRADIVALAVLVAVLLLRFPGIAAGTSVCAGSDHSWVNLPLKEVSRRAILAGELPFWNKGLSCGTPHLAQGEAGVFYPGNALIYSPLDLYRAYGWTLLLHLIALGAGTYLLLRRLACRPVVSMIVSLLFALSPYVLFSLPTSSFFQTLWLVPAALLCWDLAREGSPWTGGALGGLVVGMWMLTGRPEWIYAWIGLAVVGLAHAGVSDAPGRVLRRLGVFLLVGSAIGTALGAVQWMPTREFLPLSTRGADLPEGFNARGTWLNWNRLYTLFLFPCFPLAPQKLFAYTISNPYLGAPPVALLVAGAASWFRRRSPTLPWALGAAVGLVLALGPQTPLLCALWDLPPLSQLRFPGRALPIFFCCAYLLFGLAWESLRRSGDRLPARGAIAALALLLAGTAAFALHAELYVSPLVPLGQAALQLAPLAVVVAWRRFRTDPRAFDAAVVLACALQLAPMFFYADFTLPRDEFLRDVQTAAPVRVGAAESRRVVGGSLAARALGDRNSSALGNGSMLAGAEVVNEYQDFTFGPWRDFVRRTLYPRVTGSEPMPPEPALCDLLGIRWLLLPETQSFADPAWEPIPSGAGAAPSPRLWRRRDASPVAGVVYESVGGGRVGPEALAKLLTDGGLDPSRRVLLEGDVAPSSPASPPPAASLDEEPAGSNAFRFRVRSEAPGWFVLRDHDAPGWQASLDERPVPLLRADGMFKAVALPAGTHLVEFRYEPPSFRTASAISLAAFVVVLVLLGWCGFARREIRTFP